MVWVTVKIQKNSDTWKKYCNYPKNWTMWYYHRVMCPNDVDRMTNSADPDQTASSGAVWSGSRVFAQTFKDRHNTWLTQYFDRHVICWSNIQYVNWHTYYVCWSRYCMSFEIYMSINIHALMYLDGHTVCWVTYSLSTDIPTYANP